MLYIFHFCVYIHIYLLIHSFIYVFHLLLYFMYVISNGMFFYVDFIVYDHVHAIVGDYHSFQVIMRANVVLFTLSDVK